MTGSGMQLDDSYMNDLGPEVIPALDWFLSEAKFANTEKLKEVGILRDNLADPVMIATRTG